MQARRALPTGIEIVAVAEVKRGEVNAWISVEYLGAGEAHAIALAQQVQADWLLTDDATARVFAQSLGVEAHGSLGIVLAATALCLLTPAEARNAIQALAVKRQQLWVLQPREGFHSSKAYLLVWVSCQPHERRGVEVSRQSAQQAQGVQKRLHALRWAERPLPKHMVARLVGLLQIGVWRHPP